MTADPFPRDELPGVIAELRAVMVSSNPMDYVKAFDKVERLLATLEAMAEDGERYDHVRENAIAVLTEDDKLVIRIDIPADPKEIDRVNSRDACDMTIDAARREGA